MGLIKAVMNIASAGARSLESVVADQYQEFFTADSLTTDTLIKRGARKMARGKNVGDEDVITNGSRIVVPEGTALLLVDNGRVTDFTIESGLYTWDSSSAPSCLGTEKFFSGEGFKKALGEIANRFKAGGVINSEQRVYYVNLLENVENRFGTPSPMPYDDPTYRGIYIRVNGMFSFKIENPMTFFQSVTGNVAEDYPKEKIASQLKEEFVTELVGSLNRCGAGGDRIQYNQLPTQQSRICKYMNEALDQEWLERRGLVVVSVTLNISPDDTSRKRIEEIDTNLMYGQSPAAMQARLAGAYGDAMVTAAGNEAGATTGFVGVGMLGNMNNMMGGAQMVQGMQQQAPMGPMGQPVASQPVAGQPGGVPVPVSEEQIPPVVPVPAVPQGGSAPDANSWLCSDCNVSNTSQFCPTCGKKRPIVEQQGWECPSCHAKNDKGQFCGECGTKKP